MEDIDRDPKFWEWLRNRDKPAEQTKRLQLELPMAPMSNRKPDTDDSDRGVCIIEIM